MPLTPKHSGRRAFLRGAAGTMIALPALEYTHGHAWAQGGGDGAKRFLTVFSHGGTISNQGSGTKHDGSGAAQGDDYWRPSDPSSPDLVLGPIHEPLQPWVQKLVLLESIDNKTGMVQGSYQGGHRYCNVSCLTAADIAHNGEAVEQNAYATGPSIDQVIAERLNAANPVTFENVHLRATTGGMGYKSPYFRADNQPAGGESNPAVAHATLFDGVVSGEPDPAVVKHNDMRRAVLHGLSDEYASFANKVSSRDIQAIEAHLDHLAALEHQLDNLAICEPPPQGEANPETPLRGELMVDLIIAAMRCGLTHVANLEIGDIITPWTAAGNATGVGAAHSLGHLARDVGATGPEAAMHDTWLAEILDNRRWRMSLVARLLEGLDDPTFIEGDGTLLDNSLILVSSEFSNASKHHARNQPVLLAGGAGGALQTGRYIDYNKHAIGNPYPSQYESDESIHNLFVSILQLFGFDDTTFGSADAVHDGPLPYLMG